MDIRESARIQGVKRVRLQVHGDDRGRFVETFRKEWFPERPWGAVQLNQSTSRAGVLRGLHYHEKQIDYWWPVAGRIRVGLYDLRRDSATRGGRETFELDAAAPEAVFIPVGVAHGYFSLTDAVLCYIVDEYFDGTDELGVAWNDPEIAIPWGVDDPVLSPRDVKNPRLGDLHLRV